MSGFYRLLSWILGFISGGTVVSALVLHSYWGTWGASGNLGGLLRSRAYFYSSRDGFMLDTGRAMVAAPTTHHVLDCSCGSSMFRLIREDVPEVKDEKGKVIRPRLRDVKALVCICGLKYRIYTLFHPDRNANWRSV